MVKGQGLRKGEQIEKLGVIRVVAVRRERLFEITEADVAREGYPGQKPSWFVEHFCSAMKCKPDALITRIEFAYED